MAQGATDGEPLRVVLWGTCDIGKPRVRILCDGLRRNGVEVIDCCADVWHGVEDKSQAGKMRLLGIAWRILVAYPILAWKYLWLPRHDWVLLGYPAVMDVFVVALLARLRGAKVAMDWFISAYDTIALDRQLIGKHNPIAALIYLVEWSAVRLSNLVFMDTQAHADRMQALFGLPVGSVGRVWVGVETERFAPLEQSVARKGPFTVLFYGQFIPLHGISTIIEAANLMRDDDVDWVLIGQGQESARMEALLVESPLPRLQWINWVEYGELRSWLARADLALGIFGSSGKAASVIPNKVFQIAAAQRPLATRDSPAIRELFAESSHCAQLVAPGDAASLALAVRSAMSKRFDQSPPCHAGLARLIQPEAIGRQLLDLLQGKPG